MLSRARILALGMCCLGVGCGGATDSKPARVTAAGGAGASGSGVADAGASGADDGNPTGAAGVAGAPGVTVVASAGGSSGDASLGGAAGEPSNVGKPISAGLVVVGTTVELGAAASRHFVVLLDPADGHEVARTETELAVLAVAYEAARDKWFVFTGTPGQGNADATGALLVGTMTTAGFELEQTATVPKPTNQNTVVVLNRRILYRTATHVGVSQVGDTLTLLDTSAKVVPVGKLTIPYRYALVSAVGVPEIGAAVGGRAFFLHDNLDDMSENCAAPSVGTEPACTVYTSSLQVAAADTTLGLDLAAVSAVGQIDGDGSDAALGVQPGGNNVVIVLPPQRALSTRASVSRYDAHTGAPIGSPFSFSLETETKKIDPNNSITIPTVAVDPCLDRLFTGELANSGLLYALPFDMPEQVVAFDPASHDGIVGAVVYEPFTHTLISYNSNSTTPTFSGLQIGGSAAATQIVVRGQAGSAAWSTPQGLVPAAVAVKNPVVSPCD